MRWKCKKFSVQWQGSLTTFKKTALLEGMKKLKERANKCIDKDGMYFKEYKQIISI
jgi:hypothetical protein